MTNHNHTFVDFGFGPIGAGLFVNEAFQSNNFSELIVAEIDQQLVNAVRKNKGAYCVNVAANNSIEVAKIENVQILNPNVLKDKTILLQKLVIATEISTCLPSVKLYDTVADLIAYSLKSGIAPAKIIYAAENNNYAAELLRESVLSKLEKPPSINLQFLNTVIGKMSQVVTDKNQIQEMNLTPIVPDTDLAFLVEQFNHILVTKCTLPDFRPGIEVFIEKTDLIPFEEAKLFGHNAIHALLAYLGAMAGYERNESFVSWRRL